MTDNNKNKEPQKAFPNDTVTGYKIIKPAKKHSVPFIDLLIHSTPPKQKQDKSGISN